MNRSEKETDSLNLFHNFPIKYKSNEVFLNSANNGNKRRNLMRIKILYYEVYLPLHVLVHACTSQAIDHILHSSFFSLSTREIFAAFKALLQYNCFSTKNTSLRRAKKLEVSI